MLLHRMEVSEKKRTMLELWTAPPRGTLLHSQLSSTLRQLNVLIATATFKLKGPGANVRKRL